MFNFPVQDKETSGPHDDQAAKHDLSGSAHPQRMTVAGIFSIILFVGSIALWIVFGGDVLTAMHFAFAPGSTGDAYIGLFVVGGFAVVAGFSVLLIAGILFEQTKGVLPPWFRLSSLVPALLAVLAGLVILLAPLLTAR